MLLLTTTGIFAINQSNFCELEYFDQPATLMTYSSNRFFVVIDEKLYLYNARFILQPFRHRVTMMTCSNTNIVLGTDDGLYVQGCNRYLQIGVPTDYAREYTKIACIPSGDFISIHRIRDHTIVHTTVGVFVCGMNDYGQLRSQLIEKYAFFTRLQFDEQVISISTCHHHTVVQVTDGLYAFGRNDYGQLEFMGTETKIIRPVDHIACGMTFTIITTGCSVQIWGAIDEIECNPYLLDADLMAQEVISTSAIIQPGKGRFRQTKSARN